MATSAKNQNQKDVKEMFDLLNTKKISTKKYQGMLDQISAYAKQNGEEKFFKAILKEDIENSFK